MKFILPGFLFFICYPYFAKSQDHTAEIMKIKGKWTRHANVIGSGDPSPFGQQPVLIRKTDSIASLIRQVYPVPAGNEAFYYSDINLRPLFKNAPASYSLRSLYKPYYFNTHLNKILLATETGTGIRVHINSFGPLLTAMGDWMVDGQLTSVFYPMETEGQWKGLPLFKEETWNVDVKRGRDTIRAVLITHNGKLPYLPLTQKQYLLALKYKWEKEKQKVYESSMGREKEFRKIIEDNKKNNYIDAATKEKLIASLEKELKRYMQTREADIQKLNEQFDKKIKIIDQYLALHADKEMQQPVATATPGDFPGYFGSEPKKRAFYPVRVDPSYFKSNLPRNVPQFIVMDWGWGKDVPAYTLVKQFETYFPAEKLIAMIDGNTQEPVKKIIEPKFDPLTDPELIAITKKAERYADSVLRKGGVNKYIPAKKPVDTTFNFSMPSRNETLLSSIPTKKMNPAELKIYLEKVDKKFTAWLVDHGQQLPTVSSLNGGEICDLATLTLLKGAGETAAWLAIKAAEKDPGNIVVLNNCGAILNGCGFQPIAVNILETALQKTPGSGTLQNNLGQAYFALGDIPKATSYLQQTVSGSAYHPQANFSLACISYAQGNKTNALKYTENSLRGSFTDGAIHLIHKLKPKARLLDYLKHRYKQPDYFNEDKYKLPPQCEKTADIAALEAEYDAYRKMIEKVEKKFDMIRNMEGDLGTSEFKNNKPKPPPFMEMGTAMILDMDLRLTERGDEITRIQQIYNAQMKELNQAYENARKNVEGCGAEIALADKYMEKMAFVTRTYQKKWMPVWRDLFDEMAFWYYFSAPNKHLQRSLHAGVVSSFLGELLKTAQTNFLHTCEVNKKIEKKVEEYEMPPDNCPIDINLSFGIGSFSLDCEKIEYSFSTLLIAADASHSFKTHRTTLAIGQGLEVKFGDAKLDAGPASASAGIKLGAKAQYFVTFDGTQLTDQGFIWQAGIKYSEKINTGIDSPVDYLNEIKGKSFDLSAKTTLSLHSGAITNSGSVYQYIDKVIIKPEVQENKNIKLYNQ